MLISGACTSRAPGPGPTPRPDSTSVSDKKIIFMSARSGARSEGLEKGARVAAAEAGLDLVTAPAEGRVLAGLTDDSGVIGVVSDGAAAAIRDASVALEESMLPVVEVTDDLYDAASLGPSVFQAATPHSWQAFRLARYFGPGDRAYRKVGLLHDGSARGLSARDLASLLSDALGLRNIGFVEAIGLMETSLPRLESDAPEAVVVAGEHSFRESAVMALAEKHPYSGKSRVHQGGWHPQVAGFETLLVDIEAQEGSVAAGDYARPPQAKDVIKPVGDFRSRFREEFGSLPVSDEVLAYDAVRVIAEGFGRAGSREKTAGELEKFDRVRFGHLPISFSPSDHVMPERDVLGLFAWQDRGWSHLMRAFTSDLERTNILEEDWPSFFDGTTPGGEAPFFYTAKAGITTRADDDLR